MFRPDRMKFGIFLAPFHRHYENPTLSLERDMRLIELLDELDYDEAWVGEHHSAGWETIASPEVFMGIAAQRTRRIMLGTGVISLPYHHPLMVANRMVLLDHLTRGRVMLGVGPGALLQRRPDARHRRPEPARADGGVARRHHAAADRDRADHLQERLVRAEQRHAPPATVHPAALPDRGRLGAVAGRRHPGRQARCRRAFDRRDPSGCAAPSIRSGSGRSPRRRRRSTARRWTEHEWRIVTPLHVAPTRKEALADVQDGGTEFLRKYWVDALGNRHNVPEPDNEETLIEQLSDDRPVDRRLAGRLRRGDRAAARDDRRLRRAALPGERVRQPGKPRAVATRCSHAT